MAYHTIPYQVIYCNDGNYYCDVLNWDWTQEAARNLYTSHVLNATTQGGTIHPLAQLSHACMYQNGATSGFEMCLCYQTPVPLVPGVPTKKRIESSCKEG